MSKAAPARTQSDRFCGGPKLNAIVFDRAPVCEVAAEFAEQFNVPDPVSTVAGDTWAEEPSLETDSSGRRDSRVPAAEGRAGSAFWGPLHGILFRQAQTKSKLSV
jgi:hypothetical protein